MRFRPVRAVHGLLAEPALKPALALKRRVVAKLSVVVEAVRDVDTEPGDAPVEPEPEDLPELLVHPRLPPVQVGLAGQEVVQVVLAAGGIEGPGGRPGRVQPVVRRAPIRLPFPLRGVRPHVVVAVRRPRAGPGVDEPGMGAAGVVGHQVEHDADAALAGLGDELVHVGEGAQVRVHAEIVADVIAPVLVRGRHRRRQPDRIHAQPGQVVQAGDHAGQVAVPIGVGVSPRADVDLVQGGALPPARALCHAVHAPPWYRPSFYLSRLEQPAQQAET